MSTVTIHAEAIDRASVTCHRVMNSEWPEGRREAIRAALDGLAEARKTYGAVLSRSLHPVVAYPECPELEHDDNAYDRALAMSAQDAGDWATELDRLVPVETERSAAA